MPAAPEIIMAGVTQPTIMATTMLKGQGNCLAHFGTPSKSNRDALFPAVLSVFIFNCLLYAKMDMSTGFPLDTVFCFSNSVMRAVRPGFDSANLTAA